MSQQKKDKQSEEKKKPREFYCLKNQSDEIVYGCPKEHQTLVFLKMKYRKHALELIKVQVVE